MKRLKISLPALLLLLLVIATGCADKTVKHFMANSPTYMATETWRSQSFTFEGPRALQTPGKIYLYSNLLLVNEFLAGVHIFDNSNPSSPIDLGFLPVIGNQDIAVRNNILYVDSYHDLLSFDISDPRQPHLLNRIENVFDFDNYAFVPGYDPNYPMVEVDPNQGVVVGWTLTETSEEVVTPWRGNTLMAEDALSGGGVTLGTSNFAGGSGLAGSTARFSIYDHYLYTLESNELGVFDIQESLQHLRDVPMIFVCETLYPTGGYLYVGTTTGMLIYSLSDPSSPSYVSLYSHLDACDPVVVQGDKAFVTLSTGTRCTGALDVLEVIDLSDITMPTLLYQFQMTNPKGLGLDGNTLFLCDGSAGLKIFDKTDLSAINLNMISQFSGITAADVIPNNQVLLMTSAEGIYQYSYADLQNIVQLSMIPVQQ